MDKNRQSLTFMEPHDLFKSVTGAKGPLVAVEMGRSTSTGSKWGEPPKTTETPYASGQHNPIYFAERCIQAINNQCGPDNAKAVIRWFGFRFGIVPVDIEKYGKGSTSDIIKTALEQSQEAGESSGKIAQGIDPDGPDGAEFNMTEIEESIAAQENVIEKSIELLTALKTRKIEIENKRRKTTTSLRTVRP